MEPPRRPATDPPAQRAPWASRGWGTSVQRLTRVRVLAIVALFAVTLVVAKSCQKAQIRFGKDRAVVIAQRQIDYRPVQTQVRLVRQGINSRPYWAVSFSVPARRGKDYAKLTTVRVDANTGKVAAVNRERGVQSPAPGSVRPVP